MNISFDFDGTLENDFDGTYNSQKEEIQKILIDYRLSGHNIFIVTKRYGPNFSEMGLGNEHLIVVNLAKKLGVSEKNIFFTNRDWKVDALKWLNIHKHFENSPVEVEMISNIGIEVVPVGDPYWRDLVY